MREYAVAPSDLPVSFYRVFGPGPGAKWQHVNLAGLRREECVYRVDLGATMFWEHFQGGSRLSLLDGDVWSDYDASLAAYPLMGYARSA